MELTKEQILTEAFIATEEYTVAVNEAFEILKKVRNKIKRIVKEYDKLVNIITNPNYKDQEKRKKASKTVFLVNTILCGIFIKLSGKAQTNNDYSSAIAGSIISGMTALLSAYSFVDARKRLKSKQDAQKAVKLADAAISDAEKESSKNDKTGFVKKSFAIIKKLWDKLKSKFLSIRVKDEAKQESYIYDLFGIEENEDTIMDKLIEDYEAIDDSVDKFFDESEQIKEKIIKKMVIDHIELFKKNPKKFMNFDLLKK